MLYNLDFEWTGSLIPDLLHLFTLHSNMLAFAPDLSIYFKNSKIERLVSYNLHFQ